MTDEHTRLLLALAIIVSFFAFVLTVLLGFVNISNPEIAKLVGVLVGYFTAMLNPIIMRYYGGSHGQPGH